VAWVRPEFVILNWCKWLPIWYRRWTGNRENQARLICRDSSDKRDDLRQ
jgi:hypothetical protein